VSAPADQDRVLRDSVHSDPAIVSRAVHAILVTDLRPELGKITVPVLLLGAAKDLPLEQVTAIYRSQLSQLPAAKLVMDPNARHFVMLDGPVFFQSQVDGFLRTVTR
jgi:pimeloyl-ACP methyl ester carboxylesterase